MSDQQEQEEPGTLDELGMPEGEEYDPAAEGYAQQGEAEGDYFEEGEQQEGEGFYEEDGQPQRGDDGESAGTPYGGQQEDGDGDGDGEEGGMGAPEARDPMSARSHSQVGSRPGSAVINLRGSRPNSAAIAQEIEGFEDDFMERVEEEEEELIMEESEEDEDLGPTVEELIERAQQEQQRLMEGNEMLQKRVRMALDFKNKNRPPMNRDLSRLDGVSTRYRSALKMWVETLEERDRVEAHYQTTIFDMKSSLEERIKRADDISKAYKHFRLEVAKSSEHSKTARPISEKLLAQLEMEDQEKEEEVQRVRLKHIHLSNQLKRIEQTLRQKEELAEGLHLIDFEQLKIENQSLNEKIEERNEELLKLRKKTTTTVQILTHVREKLQFVEKENAALATQLAELDSTLSERRDKLGKAKANRDTLRVKARKIKEASVYITNPALLDDIEAQKEKREQLAVQIEELRREHMSLTDAIARTGDRIGTVTRELQVAGAPNLMTVLQGSAKKGTKK